MRIRTLVCGECDVRIEGDLPLPRLARLSPEAADFAERYLLAGGSLKQLAEDLGVSYPTVRGRLDRLIAELRTLRGDEQSRRLQILDRLERGEISARDAARELRQLSAEPPSPNSP